jgi:hypothetical protein
MEVVMLSALGHIRPRRARRTLVSAVVCAGMILTVVHGGTASANPAEVAENLAYSCAHAALQAHHRGARASVAELTGDCVRWAERDLINEAARNVLSPVNAGLVAVDTAKSLQLKEKLAPLVGYIVAQFESLTKLRMALGVDVINGRTMLKTNGSTKVIDAPTSPYQLTGMSDGTSHAAGSNDAPPPGDRSSRFEWNNTVTLIWDPNWGGDYRYTDGTAKFGLYTQSYKARPDYDFYASSMVASVTPMNGAKMKEVYIQRDPHASGMSMIEFDPTAVASYGSGGTTSLGATLEGHIRGESGSDIGGGFSIGRTWNRPEGYAGGAALHDDSHYALWRDGGKGSQYAKSAEGVETWGQATDGDVEWLIGAWAETVH